MLVILNIYSIVSERTPRNGQIPLSSHFRCGQYVVDPKGPGGLVIIRREALIWRRTARGDGRATPERNRRLLSTAWHGRVHFGRRPSTTAASSAACGYGGRVTMETVDRVRNFMDRSRDHWKPGALCACGRSREAWRKSRRSSGAQAVDPNRRLRAPPRTTSASTTTGQKYLLFVNTCSEKWVVAQRVGMELANITRARPL